MVLSKIYEVNFVDIDSAVLEIAEDIKNGYSFYEIERVPIGSYAYCKALELEPSVRITLHNKAAEKHI